MAIWLYITAAAAILVLAVLSAKEIPVSDREVAPALRPVRRMAVFLYRHLARLHLPGRSHAGKGFPGSGRVHADFAILDPSGRAGRRTALYCIDKLQNLILFVIAADVLAAAVWLSETTGSRINEGGIIVRPDYAEGDLSLSVRAEDAAQENQSLGEFTVAVGARQYTEEETAALAAALLKELPSCILGANENLSQVSSDLDLPEEVQDYPFRITWESSRYELIQTDGTVRAELLETGTQETVTLTVTLSYLEWSCEEQLAVTVVAGEVTAQEEIRRKIEEALSDSNQATASEETMVLPEEVNGTALRWTEVTEDDSALLFGLVILAGCAVFLLSDRDLHREIEKRDRQMALDYPQIVSKLVLFLGAGMSVRNAFSRMADGYRQGRDKGGERHYVYEELLLVCRELDSGISESTAYANFGIRCRSRQYARLCSLLTQNLKKGNSELLRLLQEEADLAFEERKRLARKMGEEAGTRLLLPMIMMLGITLVIIMVPAFMSFSL